MVSVIIPTHKRAELLFYELERIFSQKNIDFDVVVISDIEDEDETDCIKEKFPNVTYIKSSIIQGPSEKHKKGLSITTGDYVYLPDDDDYLIDDYFFEKAINLLEKDPSLAFVSGNVDYLYENEWSEEKEIAHHRLTLSGKIDGLVYLQEFQHIYPKPISTVSTIFRRFCLDQNMIEMSDSSMYMNALLHGNAYIMDDVVAVYRIREKKGKSLTTSASLPFIINVLKQKESLYYQAKTRIPRPRDFWSYQFINTYSLLANKPDCRREQISLVKWGLMHLHGSIKLLSFLIRQTIRVCFTYSE